MLILLALTTATLLWARLDNPYVWMVVAVAIAFGAIGSADDYLKLRRGTNDGLSVAAKFTLTCVVAATFAGVLLILEFETTLTFPFFKNLVLDLGLFYVVLVVVIVAGFSHAVNFTDG